jgi:hypothetical protein
MAEITSGSLIQDWYERFVRPLKQPISLTSSAPQDFSLGLPASPTPAPTAPVGPPAGVTPEMVNQAGQAPAVANAPVPEAGTSWSDNLTKGLQDPAKVGLLGMGLSMMATPPRSTPYSGAEIVGNAGLHGLKFFQQAVDDKRRADAMAMQQEEHKLTREDQRIYRQAQIADMESRRSLDKERIEDLGRKRAAEEALILEKAKDARQMDESVGENGFGIPAEWPNWKAAKLATAMNQQSRNATAKEIQEMRGATAETMQQDRSATAKEVQGMRGATVEKIQAKKGVKSAAAEKQFQYQDRKARESLIQQGKPNPTIAETATERQRLFPKGSAAKPKVSSLRPGAAGATPAGNRRVKMPDGSIQEFDAAGNRVK